MNEPAAPSPSDDRNDRMAFRHVFLLRAPRGGAPDLRQFGRYMYDTLLESRLRGCPEPGVRDQVRAVSEDLGFSGQVLASLPAEAKGAGLTPEEMALSMKAESWARELSEFVRTIEGSLGETGEER